MQPLGTTFLDHAVPKKETGESLHITQFGKRTVNKKHMNAYVMFDPSLC